MATGNPVGTMYVELSLDATKYTAAQKRILNEAKQNSADINRVFSVVGTKTDEMYNAMRQQVTNAYKAIAASATSSANEIRRAHEGMAKKIADIDEQQFGRRTSFLESFKKNWIAASIAIAGAAMAISKAWDMVKIGAAYEEQMGMLNNLLAKYKTTADAIISEMERASDFQIAKSELMTIALGGIAKGLNPEQLINLANAAETLGDAVGKSATEALKELTEALETGRTRGLKNYLGGALDLEKTFGDLASKLTEVEKAQAMYNITMIAAVEIQNKQNETVDKTSDNIAKLEKAYEDASLQFAQFLKYTFVWWAETLGIIDAANAKLKEFQTSVPGAPYVRMPMPERPKEPKTTAPYESELARLKQLVQARKDLGEQEKNAKKVAKEIEDARKREIDLVEKIGMAQIESAGDREAIEAKAYVEWEKVEQKKAERAYKDAEDLAEKQLKEQEKALKKSEEEWKHFWENVQDFTADAFYDIFTNLEDGWSSLLDRMKNWFLRWVAEIAAKQVVIGIQGVLGGASNSFLGGLLNLGGLAGGPGGGGGGGAFDIFKGASSLIPTDWLSSIGGGLGIGGAASLGATTEAAALVGGSGLGTMTGLGALGGLSAAIPYVGIGLGAAGILYSMFSKKDKENEFTLSELKWPSYFDWVPGQGISTAPTVSTTANETSQWYGPIANSFIEARNTAVKTLNEQLLAFIEQLPEHIGTKFEQLLAAQEGSLSYAVEGRWKVSEAGQAISQSVNNTINAYNEIIAKTLNIQDEKLQKLLATYQTSLALEPAITANWEQFVMGLQTSDLAPVQSLETFSYYYKQLRDKVKANPADMAASQALMQYTSGTYLPFAKDYMGSGQDYATMYGQLVSSTGELHNTVFSGISGISSQLDTLIAYVEELLDKQLTVNIDGKKVTETVAGGVDKGYWVPVDYSEWYASQPPPAA